MSWDAFVPLFGLQWSLNVVMQRALSLAPFVNSMAVSWVQSQSATGLVKRPSQHPILGQRLFDGTQLRVCEQRPLMVSELRKVLINT